MRSFLRKVIMESAIENSLIKIAQVFNVNKINWAIGASTMLRLRGIEISVHDIDLMVSDNDFLLAHTLLSSFCVEQSVTESKLFKTLNFKRYTYNEIDIDLMAGFGIIHKEGLFDYHFKDYDGSTILNGVNIPLCYVEDWLVFYNLMPNRTNTIRLIDSYIVNHPLNRLRLDQLLELTLPQSVRNALISLIVK